MSSVAWQVKMKFLVQELIVLGVDNDCSPRKSNRWVSRRKTKCPFDWFTWSTLPVLPQFLPLQQQSSRCFSLWTQSLLLERTPQILPVNTLDDTKKNKTVSQGTRAYKISWPRSASGLDNDPIMQRGAFVTSTRKLRESHQTHPGVVLDEPVFLLRQ